MPSRKGSESHFDGPLLASPKASILGERAPPLFSGREAKTPILLFLGCTEETPLSAKKPPCITCLLFRKTIFAPAKSLCTHRKLPLRPPGYLHSTFGPDREQHLLSALARRHLPIPSLSGKRGKRRLTIRGLGGLGRGRLGDGDGAPATAAIISGVTSHYIP